MCSKLFVLCLVVCGAVAVHDYTGFTVFRLRPKTQQQKESLREITESENYDVWADPRVLTMPVDVMVDPIRRMTFLDSLKKIDLEPEIYIEDVQSLIETEVVDYGKSSRDMQWDRYYNLNAINAWLDKVAEDNPNTTTVVYGGRSYQNRKIKGLKISFGPGKKTVFVEGGIHAREWISPATTNYLINELLTSDDERFRRMAESFDWYIFPVTNPDGYQITFTFNRLWRKTAKPYGVCLGADPNRNWDFHWAEIGSSRDPCSETYAGPNVYSEPEAASLSEFISNVAPNMVAYISFHSYSQLFLIPYGNTTDHLGNYDEMIQIGNRATQALEARYGTKYVVGNIAETIYTVSGSSIDWVKNTYSTPIVACYELRDTGRHGFLLPADQIKPNGEEVMDSFVAMFEEAEKIGYVSLNDN